MPERFKKVTAEELMDPEGEAMVDLRARLPAKLVITDEPDSPTSTPEPQNQTITPIQTLRERLRDLFRQKNPFET